ncbi:MAG: hypothetical protein Kow0037_29000 [Calditrichia bacterium]
MQQPFYMANIQFARPANYYHKAKNHTKNSAFNQKKISTSGQQFSEKIFELRPDFLRKYQRPAIPSLARSVPESQKYA